MRIQVGLPWTGFRTALLRVGASSKLWRCAGRAEGPAHRVSDLVLGGTLESLLRAQALSGRPDIRLRCRRPAGPPPLTEQLNAKLSPKPGRKWACSARFDQVRKGDTLIGVVDDSCQVLYFGRVQYSTALLAERFPMA